MGEDILDLYSDYLLISSRKTTATGLSEPAGGAISHDQITRFSCGRRTEREAFVAEDKEADTSI
jgi:hypothetical protein